MFSNDTVIVIAQSLIIFVNQFTIITIVSLLFDFGSSPMILILISCHSPSSISSG